MDGRNFAVKVAVLVVAAVCGLRVNAQAIPTASQGNRLSAFGGVTGTYTGLEGGKNAGITAGIDLSFPAYHRYLPIFEVRGTYPVDKGTIDGQKNILFGLKVERQFGRFHPYGDFLFGRGEIDYGAGGFPNYAGTITYQQSVTNVISPGVGVDFDVARQFAIKVDGQFQRYSTPVTASGHIYSKPVTIGVVYRFDFNHHPKEPKGR